MKKSIVVLLVLGLIFASLAGTAEAKKKGKKPTVVTGTYATPAFGAAGAGVALCAQSDANGCVSLSGAGQAYVSVEVVDQTGLPVAASVTQDTNGDQQADTGVDICGKSDSPIPIDPSYPIDVFIFEGPCTAPPGPAVATTGTVKATFTSTP